MVVIKLNCDKHKKYCKLKIWVKSVIEREGECQKCGSKRNLEAHHMQKQNRYDKHYFDQEWGVCLCRDCHREFHKHVPYYYTRETTLKYLIGVKNIL